MRRRVTLVTSIVVAVLSLSLLGSTLGGARSSVDEAVIAHAPAPTALLGQVPATAAEQAGLRPLETARKKRGPRLARKRAVHPRRGGFVQSPKGGRSDSGSDRADSPPASAPGTPNAAPPATPSAPPVAPEAPRPGAQAPEPPIPAPPAPTPPEPAPPTPAPTEPAPPSPTPPRPPVVEPSEPVPPRTQDPEPSLPALFEGERIADFDDIQAAPNAITEVADPLGSGETVLRMTVDDDHVAPITPTENPRAQALSPSLIESGDELWLATKFLLPADFPAVPGWLSLVSIYGPPFAGSSPWQIGVTENEFTWQRNDSYGYDVPWRMPATKGRWVELLLHERFAGDGWVEMWIDGERVTFFPDSSRSTERLAMATMDSSNNGGANHAKIMNYREAGMFETATVYFGALRLGETRASVEG